MDIKTYAIESEQTLIRKDLYFDSREANILHAALGLVTESSELADVVKKKIFYNRPDDVANIKEEIGDVLWYLMILVREYGFDIEEILDENIEKLKKRWKTKIEKEKTIMETNMELKSQHSDIFSTPPVKARIELLEYMMLPAAVFFPAKSYLSGIHDTVILKEKYFEGSETDIEIYSHNKEDVNRLIQQAKEIEDLAEAGEMIKVRSINDEGYVTLTKPEYDRYDRTIVIDQYRGLQLINKIFGPEEELFMIMSYDPFSGRRIFTNKEKDKIIMTAVYFTRKTA